jgi:Icc-related predicted phosphoesterase
VKKKILVIGAIVLAVAMLVGGGYGALILFQPFQRDNIVGYGERYPMANTGVVPMPLRENGEFVVLQFTDTHLVNTRGPDARTLRELEHHIARVQPDLVVITGDVINGRGAQAFVLVDRAAALQALIDIFARHNQPWAMVPGNNDHDNFLGSVHDVTSFLAQHCEHFIIAQQPDLPGAIHFVLPLVNENNDTAHQLIFFDTLSRFCEIDPMQAQWLAAQLDYPSTVFMHHNTPIFTDLGLAEWPSDRGDALNEVLLHENVRLVSIGHVHVAPTRRASDAGTIFQIGRVSGYRRGDSDPGGVVITITPGADELYTFEDFAY